MERLIRWFKKLLSYKGCPNCKYSMKGGEINLKCVYCYNFNKYEYKDWSK